MRQYNAINPLERIISAISYLTSGLAGFIWLVIAALAKKSVRPFLMYHIMQSIFISIAYYIFIELYKLTYIIFAKIPLINALVFMFNSALFTPLPLFWGLSFLQILTSAVIIYLSLTSFMGLYSYLPWVSDIIRKISGN